MNVGSIVASLRLNIQNFVNGIRQAQNSMNSWTNGGSSGLNQMSNAADNLGTRLRGIEHIIGGILVSQAFYRMTNQLQDAAGASLQFMQNMEKAQIGMEYFLGNKKDANAFIMSMQDFAADTSFNTEQALTLSRRLMGAQFAPEQVKSIMSILNDAAAATGGTPEQIDRIVLALTQLRTNGKIAGQELRQLGEAGIPIYKMLSEELGIAEDKLLRIGELRIPGDAGVMAVLKGLEKRYKGAADRISDTWGGMMDTIRDDTLMIVSDLMQKPYKAVEGVIRVFRDKFEEVRKAGFKGGSGGILASLFSPETQYFVRIIVGSIQSLIQGLGKLTEAFKPVVQMVTGWFLQAFTNVLPIIAGVVNRLAELANGLLQASPYIQYFVGTIMTIMVVETVARALLIFWRVVGLGAICTSVAAAIRKLYGALQLVMLLMVENPLTALFILLAGVLAYFALQVKAVQNALSGLYGTLASFAGFDPNSVMKLKLNTAADSMDKFNKSITAGASGLSNVGKNIDDAAKKAKNMKDIMSFDEVYRLEDKTADAAEGLTDGLGIGGMPGVGLPDLSTVGDTDIGSLLNGSKHPQPGFWDEMWDNFKRGWKVFWEWVKGIGQSLDDWWEGIKFSAIKWTYDLAKSIGDWFTQTKIDMATWVFDTSMAFGNWVSDTSKAFGNWVADVAKGFWGWVTDTSKAFGGWVVDVAKAFWGWVTDTSKAVGNWVADTAKAFAGWVVDTAKTVGGWVTDVGTAIADWSFNATQKVKDWVTNTTSDFKNWAVEAGASISGWYNDTKQKVEDWANSTGTKIGTWFTDTKTKLETWATSTGSKITTWATNAKSDISSWYTETSSKIGTWYTDTKAKFETWVTETGTKISKWFGDRKTEFTNWAADAKTSVTNWYNDTYPKINKWVTDKGKELSDWATNTTKDFTTWASNVPSKISEGLTAAKNALGSIFKDFYKNFVKDPLNEAIDGINAFIDKINSLSIKLPDIDIPGLPKAKGGTIGFDIKHIPHLATGGIVQKDTLVRMGEGNKKEAVIPLQNPSYMKPFSDAVASQVLEMMGGSEMSRSSTINNFNVGVLIGDERSYRELERKLKSIRLTEETRTGGALPWQRV